MMTQLDTEVPRRLRNIEHKLDTETRTAARTEMLMQADTKFPRMTRRLLEDISSMLMLKQLKNQHPSKGKVPMCKLLLL